MLYWTTFKVALSSLFANKFRTFLAMLGIIIGVAAVIAMLGIGSGAQRKVLAKVSEFGTNFLFVKPQPSEENGVTVEDTKPTLTIRDAEDILQKVQGIRSIGAMVWNGGQVSRNALNTWTQIVGITNTVLDIRNFKVDRGRVFTEKEDSAGARVAVITSDVVARLFPDGENPVGQEIWINEFVFKVIGTIKRKGDSDWKGADRLVFIPLNTAMKRAFGNESLDEMNVHVFDKDQIPQVIAQTTVLLRRNHHLRARQSNDFHIMSQDAVLEMAMDVQNTFRILLATIAGISLLVGGIGIMNIMLVTVKERTREIGVRKAIGAREKDILRQFLLEAVFMCGIGGAIGCGLGIGSSLLIDTYTEYKTVIEPISVIISFSVSAAVGVFFGYYPASRAASLDTIDALRYE